MKAMTILVVTLVVTTICSISPPDIQADDSGGLEIERVDRPEIQEQTPIMHAIQSVDEPMGYTVSPCSYDRFGMPRF